MKLEVKSRINDKTGHIEIAEAIKDVSGQVESLINSRKELKQFEGTLVVTIISNPTEEERDIAVARTDKLWTIVSEKVANNFSIYAVNNRLDEINVSGVIESLLIAIGLVEFGLDSPARSGRPDDEEARRPIFQLKEPERELDEVMMEDSVRQRINRALAIVRNRDIIFEKWGFRKVDHSSKSIVILYGPAGTGKTMTAEAMGHALGKKIVHASYAEIESCYVGEGAKNLRAAFEFAEKNDAVLFFDEADSFLSQRVKNTEHASDKHYNRMSNELFQLLEQFNGLIVFATNLLTDVDEAFKSRIIDSILFDLPNEEMRIRLIRTMLPEQFPLDNPLTEAELSRLSSEIDGFSGRDIRKSMLLSLSGASIKFSSGEKSTFDFADVAEGFREVKANKEQIEREAQGLSIDDAQNLYDEQMRVEKTIDMVRHAMWLESKPDESIFLAAEKLGRTLPGFRIDRDNPKKASQSVEEVCKSSLSSGIKESIICGVINILTCHGSISEQALKFLDDILSLMGYNTADKESIKKYAECAADLSGCLIGFKF